MKTSLVLLVTLAVVSVTATAQVLQPEVLYSFPLGPSHPQSDLVQASDGSFYGTTYNGGRGDLGTIFRVTTNGVVSTVASFNGGDGAHPMAGLVQGPDGNFYGTTYEGGSDNYGTVFKVATNGVLTSLASFNGYNGQYPYAKLALGPDGNFYGTTYGNTSYGEFLNLGSVFNVTTNGQLTVVFIFASSFSDGSRPRAGMVLGRDGSLYGTTERTMFRLTTNGVLTTLATFMLANGVSPRAQLVEGDDGSFFGTTYSGGSSNLGTVFRVTTNGLVTPLVSFTSTNGAKSYSSLVRGSDGSFYGTTYQGGYSNLGTVFRMDTNGELSTLLSFTGDNGALPRAGMVLTKDGVLFGTTYNGGSSGYGTVFRVGDSGDMASITSFSHPQGATPRAALVQTSDGDLYGTTDEGGETGQGTAFKLGADGIFRTMVSFNGINGTHPVASLLTGPDGNLYGTTSGGGSSNYGAICKLASNGTFTTIASFTGDNGAYPTAELVLGRDGDFYGTAYGSSTVFKMTTNGVLTNFSAVASGPYGGLVQARDGNFYGTTIGGFFPVYGKAYRISSGGIYTEIATFGYDKAHPYAHLIQAADGNFYGTTANGGTRGYGTVFKMTSSGELTTLVSFNGSNGGEPYAGLLQTGDGNFYGTTSGGFGGAMYGTVFQVTPGGALTTLVPFDYANGARSQAGLILGQDGNLYGTTTRGGSGGGGVIFRLSLRPRITLHPADRRVNQGTDTLFLVTAYGLPTLTYQWRFNGVEIPAATNASYMRTKVQLADAGNYWVAISNSLGWALSADATLHVNLPPLADARATPLMSISPNGTNATVVLDGTRSSDPDGDALQYTWSSSSFSPLGDGALEIALLPVGSNTINLSVSDGLDASTNSVVVRIITSSQASEELISLVQRTHFRNARPFLASLGAARASVGRGNGTAAINQLHAFQNQVGAQAELEEAGQLIQMAQRIIDVLDDSVPGALMAKHCVLNRYPTGKIRMTFPGALGGLYIVEASTNLSVWMRLGVAVDLGTGSFEFEDTTAAKYPKRFYRVISPLER